MVWRSWGEGEPLVLLHGQSGSWRHWVRTIGPFAANRQVWCPDLAAMGDSDLPPGAGDIEDVASVLAQGLRDLPELDAPFDLVGFSLGGIVGALATRSADLRPRRFIVVGCTAIGLPMPRLRLRSWKGEADAARRLALQRENLGQLMLTPRGAADPLALGLYAHDLAHDRYAGRPVGTSTLLRDALGDIDAPVAGIWGALDALVEERPERARAALQSVRPDLRFATVADAGHWVAFEQPAAFNAALQDLLA